MRVGFRAKVFVASLLVTAAALAVLSTTITIRERAQERAAIEQRLMTQARLIAQLLSANASLVSDAALDDEADRLAELVGGRVTLIAADGRVVGESTLDAEPLAQLDNHLQRPEVQAAARTGLGIVQRFSTTTREDMLYAAVPSAHARVAFVRVAERLTAVADQVRQVGSSALVAFALAAPLAVALSWLSSAFLSRRVRQIAYTAERYRAGDLSTTTTDVGDDELGSVARILDTSIHELALRVDELSRDRARMEAILTGMVEGVLVVDRDGHVQLVNRTAHTMLHVDPGAEGRAYTDVIRHPDLAAQLAGALAGRPVNAQEFTLPRDPGRTFVASATSVANGGAVLVLHDITELRRADQVRRDFVANVSHELRTPLTSIRGYVEALLDDASTTGSTRQFLEVIGRQGARMERLVTDLLRLARLDARQETLDRTPCRLEPMLQGLATDLEPAIASKQQHVAIVIAPNASVVDADPGKLYDVLRNLVENAVNYSPAGATIRLSSQRYADQVAIIVTDSGPGIPPEDLTRVFERFYRVDKSRARPGGTGLGLAIARHLVELHNGRIWAENRPAGGAQFTVLLPAPTT